MVTPTNKGAFILLEIYTPLNERISGCNIFYQFRTVHYKYGSLEQIYF